MVGATDPNPKWRGGDTGRLLVLDLLNRFQICMNSEQRLAAEHARVLEAVFAARGLAEKLRDTCKGHGVIEDASPHAAMADSIVEILNSALAVDPPAKPTT